MKVIADIHNRYKWRKHKQRFADWDLPASSEETLEDK